MSAYRYYFSTNITSSAQIKEDPSKTHKVIVTGSSVLPTLTKCTQVK